MSRELYDQGDHPLPRDWLPAATPLEGTHQWNALFARVVAATPPVWRPRTTWPSVLGSWWRPAAGLAAAAAALLFLMTPQVPLAPPSGSADGALTLSLVAAGGEPAALLEGLGIPADPVLALIAVQGQAR